MSGLVENLIRLVASAFYTDECIVVLEGLIRERFLKDDEMGKAVNLQTRQVRRVLAELHRDHIVSIEALNDKKLGGSSSCTYWYIDYKHFVDVVKYRLYKINEYLKEHEQLEMVRQAYYCSNSSCGREYTALEAQRLITPGQFEFRCGHCSEPLLECSSNEALAEIQAMQKRFKAQMNRQEGLHDGITEQLRKIAEHVAKGHVLPTNLPSENRAAGIGGESTTIGSSRAGNGGGTNGARNKDGTASTENAQSFLYGYGSQQQQIEVNIDGMVNHDDFLSGRKRKSDEVTEEKPEKAGTNLPEFLVGSSITGHLGLHSDKASAAADTSSSTSVVVKEASPDGSMLDAAITDEQHEQMQAKYEAELKKYDLKEDEKVEIQLDQHGWGGSVAKDDLDSYDDELEDVEWESCDNSAYRMMHRLHGQLGEMSVNVEGCPKKLASVTRTDLDKMSNDEYKTFYGIVAEVC